MNLLVLTKSDLVEDKPNCAVIKDSTRLRHISSTLKAQTGTTLKAGMVDGKVGKAEIISFSTNHCLLELNFNSLPPPPLDCTLIMAMPRPKSLKKALEAAIVMGVKSIYIIQSWRVEKSYWSSPVLNAQSLLAISHKALEQSVDTVLPSIKIKRRFRPFVEDELLDIIGNRTAFVAHPYHSIKIPAKIEDSAVIVIGPEGGFIPFEVELLQSHGCQCVTMGKRILRVEHAVTAFLGKLL
ncbi:16S rRNA (uracil(1498)-N(3))-methyltransferase [Chitinispirillales bacterium ANBcel5]|uniref:16S rRNA (uracil(1498)-N(3))-methyltransferase n=1 Tax=Cellulosispirillum alkaliphilum TaxID=3039283 RepID=UPI002A508980|nr:16S rRNA (uracil(1498)-N(3))-methyltransferase [Chitinispirillales bacterium ANBcel5]